MDGNTTMLVVVALGAYVLAKRGGLLGGAAPGAGGEGMPGPTEGTFTPAGASRMPDFERVTEGYNLVAPDLDRSDIAGWNRDVLSKALSGEHFYDPEWHDLLRLGLAVTDEGFAPTVGAYHAQLFRPASRIDPDTLTKGDFERAAQFLAGGWKKGLPGGSPPQLYDEMYGKLNQLLEAEAAGLEIGASIGIGLASIFGFGAGAKASDDAFGFGRGAAEDRKAIVDVKNTTSPDPDVGVANAYAIPKTNPAGVVIGKETLRLSGAEYIACYPNLFYPLYRKYDPGAASKSVRERQLIKGRDGTDYIRIGYAYPWWSVEMGANLSLRERVYIRARMLCTLNVIGCTLFPRAPETVEAGNVAAFVEGSTESLTHQVPVRYDAATARFGILRGSIFPPQKRMLGPGAVAPQAPSLIAPGSGLSISDAVEEARRDEPAPQATVAASVVPIIVAAPAPEAPRQVDAGVLALRRALASQQGSAPAQQVSTVTPSLLSTLIRRS